MLRPAPLPSISPEEQPTALLPVALQLPRRPWPLLALVAAVFSGATLVSFSVAMGSLTLAAALRDVSQPAVIVAAPPLPAPVAPGTR